MIGEPTIVHAICDRIVRRAGRIDLGKDSVCKLHAERANRVSQLNPALAQLGSKKTSWVGSGHTTVKPAW